MQMNIENFSEIFGKKLNGDEIRSFNIHSLALNALINNAVFENEYDNIKYILDEKIIAKKTKERIPQLYDSNNQLNELFLKTFLNQQQLKIEDIVQIINFETRDEYFKQSFFEVDYPLFFSEKINKFDNHIRNISFIDFELDKVTIEDIIGSDDADSNITKLENFYNKNISNYMSDENRDIEFFIIDKELIKKDFIPTKFEIQEYYNNNKNIFKKDEERDFLQFNFKTANEALEFKDTIKDLSFNKIIEHASKNEIRFNEFKNIKSHEVLEDISEALFKLKINEQSEIIETSLANHILILQSIKEAKQLNFEEVKEEIISTIIDIDSSNFYRDLSDQISNKILSGTNIKKIANEFKLKIENVNNLSKNFNFKDTKIDDIIISDLIIKSFASNKDFVSDMIVLNENLSYVFNVVNIKKSEPLSIEKIKNKVFEDWKFFKRNEKITNMLNNNAEKLDYINSLSKNYNVEIKNIEISKNFKDIPISFVNILFENEINKNLHYVEDEKVYVAIANSMLFQNDLNNENLISLNNDLKASFGQELMQKKKIKINDALISALIERY